MTEQLYSYPDLEYSNKLDKLEEEADKLNELTFNSELPWEYDEVNLDHEGFKAFEFDNIEINGKTENKVESAAHFENNELSNDLLGLTGSLINSGIFKSHENNQQRFFENSVYKDDEFKTAFSKLELVDLSPVSSTEINDQKSSDMVLSNSNAPPASPFDQLSKFSESLQIEFQQYMKADTNVHVLNQIVAKHLNLLKKQLMYLNLPMDILPQLKYFRVLMTFISIDNKLTEIQAKFSSNLPQLNHEISLIIQHFYTQTPQIQLELCSTHPFYANLVSLLSASMKPVITESVDVGRADSGWMSEAERDWLIKIQTRNLTTTNPYVHDYYYTQHTLRRMTEARDREIQQTGCTNLRDPLSLLPSPITGEQLGAGLDPNKDGLCPPQRPLAFENSLGVLSPSNLHAPRQILQLSPSATKNLSTSISSSSTPASPYHLIRKRRELLGLIEKMYSIILRVDEVDKSLARMLVEQHKSRGVLVQHRNYLLKLLMDSLTNNERFIQLLSVSKGSRVIVSTIAIVSSTQFVQLLRVLFFNSISVCESEFFSDIQNELRALICSRIRNLNRDELVFLSGTIYGNGNDGTRMQPLSGFCNNEFGLYIILTLLDSILKTDPEGKARVTHFLSITIKATGNQDILIACMKDFKYLFPTSDRH